MKLLVTGAAGKVGQAFLPAFLGEQRFSQWEVVALCNNRVIETDSHRVTVIRGSMADDNAVEQALEGVSHVLHLAAVKESPDLAIEVALKGLYLLLDRFRRSATGRQFMLLSGDCVVGHIFQGYAAPITEASPRRAYPGILCANQGDGRGDAGTVRHPVRPPAHDIARAMDHGKG